MKCKEFLKSWDIFGKQIEISDSHNTPIGGFVTIVLRTLMALYVFSLFRTMFTYNDDKTYQHQYSIIYGNDNHGHEEEHAVELMLHESGIITHFGLYFFGKEDGIQRNLPYNNETKRFIRARYAQKWVDFTLPDEKDYYRYKFHPAKQCEKSDFLKFNKYDKFRDLVANQFDGWEGFYILCPDFNFDYELKNTDA